MGGSDDEGHILCFHDLGRSMLFDLAEVVSTFPSAVKEDQQGQLRIGFLGSLHGGLVQKVVVSLSVVLGVEAFFALAALDGFAFQSEG